MNLNHSIYFSKAAWQCLRWMACRAATYRSVRTAWQWLAFKGWISVHLSWRSALVLAFHTWRFSRQSKKGIRHCAFNKTKARSRYRWLWLLVKQLFCSMWWRYFSYTLLKYRLPSNNKYFTVFLYTQQIGNCNPHRELWVLSWRDHRTWGQSWPQDDSLDPGRKDETLHENWICQSITDEFLSSINQAHVF